MLAPDTLRRESCASEAVSNAASPFGSCGEGTSTVLILALLRALWRHFGAIELLRRQQPWLGQWEVREVDVVRPIELCCGIPWLQVVPKVSGMPSDGQG